MLRMMIEIGQWYEFNHHGNPYYGRCIDVYKDSALFQCGPILTSVQKEHVKRRITCKISSLR